MAKKKGKSGGQFLKMFFLLLNIGAAVLLVAAFLSQFIDPSTSLWIAYAGLIFHYLVLINMAFVLFWLVFAYKWALISVVCLLINVNNIDKFFQVRKQDVPKACVNDVKVMSYNVRLFGLYDTENKKERREKLDSFLRFIDEEQPDFLCFQEYFYDKVGDLNFPTKDSIKSKLHIQKDREIYQYFTSNRNEEYYYGFAIFSKYKVLHKEPVLTPDSSSTIGIFVDFRYKKDTLRLYNIHLASIRFDEEDYNAGLQIKNNDLNDPYLNQKAKKISQKIDVAFRKRAKQAQILREHIENSPYPVIVCGDMNDTPVSYAYNTIAGIGLRDSFRESGLKIGKTYSGDIFPNYRIDYILHDDEYNSFGYNTYPEVKLSDHQPISCVISLINQLK